MSFIQRLTVNINDATLKIQHWAMGVNNVADPNPSFLKKNKTKIIALLFFAPLTLAFYMIGWTFLFNLFGIMLILFFVLNLITVLGWLFVNAKKLVKKKYHE